MRIFNAQIYDTDKRAFFKGSVEFENGIITEISDKTDGYIDAEGACLLPGFIDVHTHGRGGVDFMSAEPDKISECFKLYLKHGITTIFPCVMTAPYNDILKAIDNIKSAKTDINVDGIHVEGPYISPKRPGCHVVSQLRPLYCNEAEELTKRISPKKAHFTVAPELEGADMFIKTLIKNGATVGIGHSDCTYNEAVRALDSGCVSFTHTYNAMRELKHREPGTVGAALSGKAYAEFICDLFHVCAPVLDLSYRLIGCEKIVIISDSIAAADMEDGVYYLSGMQVNVKDGKAVNNDGAIAGSTTNIFDGLKNLCKATGAPLEDLVLAATANPAKQVGIYDKTGSIAVGKRADMILTDKDSVLLTVAAGKIIQS